jgi:hypothetical protein
MARYAYKGTFRDGHGHIVSGGTVSVYLAGTTTAASIYTTSVIVTAVNSVTSSTDGTFLFYVDDADYGFGQKFKIILSGTGYTSQTYDNLDILGLPWTTNTGCMKFWTYQADALADDGSFNLPTATDGILIVSCNAEGGMWVIRADGSVVLVNGSTNTAATDSDGNLSVFDGGTYATVKNCLGATGCIRAMYFYN